MKTAFNSNNKDDIAITTVIAAGLLILASGLFSGNAAIANETVEVRTFDTIVVNASRSPDAVLDTIIVTASRKRSLA